MRKSKQVTVIGLGKIGLPLALAISSKGFYSVVGLDIDNAVVEKINDGISPIFGEPRVEELLISSIKNGRFRAEASYAEALKGAEIIIIATPMYTDSEDQPDFSILDSVVTKILEHLTCDALVILETTVPVGTTRDRILNRFAQIKSKKVSVGFSPERISTGRFFKDLANYPKVVGGSDQWTTELIGDFYRSFIDFSSSARKRFGDKVIWKMESIEAAEFVKLAETTYRDVNIALANQFQHFATSLSLSFREIRDASNSQYHSHIHSPGIWVGGHCIPVYPHFYLWNDPEANLLRESRKINTKPPTEIRQLLVRDYASLRNFDVGILGLAYRGGVKESAYSGTFEIIRELTEAGFNRISVHDPLFGRDEVKALGLENIESFKDLKIIIVQTDHFEYKDLCEEDFPSAELIVDGRGILNKGRFPSVNFVSFFT